MSRTKIATINQFYDKAQRNPVQCFTDNIFPRRFNVHLCIVDSRSWFQIGGISISFCAEWFSEKLTKCKQFRDSFLSYAFDNLCVAYSYSLLTIKFKLKLFLWKFNQIFKTVLSLISYDYLRFCFKFLCLITFCSLWLLKRWQPNGKMSKCN